MNSQEESQGQAQLEHQRQLLDKARQRLRILEIQRVQEGYQARPQIVTEIESLEAQIKKYESNITEIQKILHTQHIPVKSYKRGKDTTSNPPLSQRWLWLAMSVILILLLVFGLWWAFPQSPPKALLSETPLASSSTTVHLASTPSTPSLIFDSGFEKWLPDEKDKDRYPRTQYWTSYSGQANEISYLYRDNNNPRAGEYSCRIKGPGHNERAFLSYNSYHDILLPANKNLQLRFDYRTEGEVQIQVRITWTNYPDVVSDKPPDPWDLENAASWTTKTIDFHSPSTESGKLGFWLRFEVTGTGTVWVDEVSLTEKPS